VLHASDLDYAIVRTMILYGAAMNIRPNFVTWLISALKENKNLKIADVFGLENEIISPITTSQLNQLAPRPLRSGFNIVKATTELGVNLSNIDDGLKVFKRQFRKVKS